MVRKRPWDWDPWIMIAVFCVAMLYHLWSLRVKTMFGHVIFRCKSDGFGIKMACTFITSSAFIIFNIRPGQKTESYPLNIMVWNRNQPTVFSVASWVAQVHGIYFKKTHIVHPQMYIYIYGYWVVSGPHGTAFINCTCMFEGSYIYLPSTHIYQRHS